ncbi:hypothetical protein RJT34_11066 [Clitoria ternatea]|uniref:Uncharacterized protein n=1 Tax=Clitoria ternatea TaxID=43366 RepID=A0AAN9JLD1_CLITE
MHAMLNADFRKRPTTEAVLNHRFMTGALLDCSRSHSVSVSYKYYLRSLMNAIRDCPCAIEMWNLMINDSAYVGFFSPVKNLTRIAWNPPNAKFLKLNTGGSVLNNSILTAYAGLFRDRNVQVYFDILLLTSFHLSKGLHKPKSPYRAERKTFTSASTVSGFFVSACSLPFDYVKTQFRKCNLMLRENIHTLAHLIVL